MNKHDTYGSASLPAFLILLIGEFDLCSIDKEFYGFDLVA